MEFIEIIKSSKWDDWKDSLFCLFFTLIGSLLPVYGGAILVRIWIKWPGLMFFFSQGELTIYSAAFLTSVIYIMIRSSKPKNYAIIIPIACLFITALLFAGAKSKNFLSTHEINIDELFIFKLGLLIYIISIISFFLVNLLQNIRMSHDFRAISEKKYENFESSFEKLGA